MFHGGVINEEYGMKMDAFCEVTLQSLVMNNNTKCINISFDTYTSYYITV